MLAARSSALFSAVLANCDRNACSVFTLVSIVIRLRMLWLFNVFWMTVIGVAAIVPTAAALPGPFWITVDRPLVMTCPVGVLITVDARPLAPALVAAPPLAAAAAAVPAAP